MANETNGIGIVVPENEQRLGGVDRYFGEQVIANQQNKEGSVGNPAPVASDIPSKNTVDKTTMKGIAGVIDSDVQNQFNNLAGAVVNSSGAYFTTPPFTVSDKDYINNSTAIRNKKYSDSRDYNVAVNLKETI